GVVVAAPDPLAGNDTLTADANNTPLHGGAGNDTLTGSWASSTLYGDSGNDVLNATGGPGNVLDGGEGDDTLTGGWGTDTFRGGDGNDIIHAPGGSSNISGGSGNDQITSAWAADTIDAGAGDDIIHPGGGGDTVRGGLGNDQIINELWGNDRYLYARGDGQDLLLDGNGQDLLTLEGVQSDQLWFSQVGNDLTVSLIGTQDSVTLQNWYLGSQYHVEQIKTSDGKTLLDSQVQNLVSAMASFAPPAAGQTTLPAAYQGSLNTVIAANWH
ncbi:calcium-binding protein, partial [Rhodoferax sp.]|uniref:calcium-binding protein n=1 Tax=Rhodoferax sp. TaxID=50421 RepID=UPI00263621BF